MDIYKRPVVLLNKEDIDFTGSNGRQAIILDTVAYP